MTMSRVASLGLRSANRVPLLGSWKQTARLFNSAAQARTRSASETRFTSPDEAFAFGVSQMESMEVTDFYNYTRRIWAMARARGAALTPKEVFQSETFRDFLQGLRSKLATLNPTDAISVLSACSSILPLNATPPRELRDPAAAIFNRVVKGELQLPSELVPEFVACLLKLGITELSLISYVKDSCAQFGGSLSPGKSRLMLKCLYKLQIRDRELTSRLLANLETNLDQYRNRDVLLNLQLFATTPYYSPVVMKQCAALLTNHASLFDAGELVTAYRCGLRIGGNDFNPSQILSQLSRRVRQLRYQNVVNLLEALLWSYRSDSALAAELVQQLLITKRPLSSKARAILVYGICRFNLQDKAAVVRELAPAVVSQMPRSAEAAQMIVDIVYAAKEQFRVDLQVPSDVVPAVEHLCATASSAAKHEAYTISNLIPQLRPEFQLQFAESVKVGPYTVPLVDESNKVAILIPSSDTLIKPFIELQALNSKGYQCAVIAGSRFRKLQEDKKAAYLERTLSSPLFKLGRLSQEQLDAIRERRI